MRYLPIFLDVRDQTCLLIGAGAVAARKLALLRAAGARVRIVAPECEAEIAALIDGDAVHYTAGAFSPEQLEGCHLVISATDSAEVNAAVAFAARARNLPVNVVDSPELCSFIVPAIIDRDPITVAVSSAGKSPVLARWIRSRIETLLPSSIGKLAEFMGERRAVVQAQLPQVGARRRFWEQLLTGIIPPTLAQGKIQTASDLFNHALLEKAARPPQGRVYLIGAGPGEPDLLTFRALQRLQEADVVVYDRLVAPAVVELARRDATRLYVGKCRDAHSVPQAEISQTLVELAQQGKIVARLKGGDPFIFGRGGEEAQTLAAAGVPFEIIPGITAASGCAAYAGIPLTHRDYAQSVRFITGHTQDGKLSLNWAHLAQGRETLVFYMGLTATAEICAQLQAHGLPADYPAALIEQGTTARQRVIAGTLATLPDLIAGAESPSLLIVGEVVSLHAELKWFEGAIEAPAAFKAATRQRAECAITPRAVAA
ncbi:MAG: uroporphyrinogen-III C-methyltransferase [Halothiobacillus sp. 28-55-5]|nr:MAG: uroporphyrinogen-III C-methyltransferase [Halothiobacillus sp. 28-55-5]